MEQEQQFREPTKKEQELLNRLLEAEFPGRDELGGLIRQVQVRTIDGTVVWNSEARSAGKRQ